MKLFKARAGDICKEGSVAGKAGMRRAERDGESAWRVSCGAFYVFFAYTIFIWCCESADLACWLAGVRQATLLSRLAALLLALLIAGKAAGIPKCKNVQPDRFFALGCMAITLFFAAKSIRPDMSYDTQNYHLLSQIPGFVDNLHYHAMPGRFQMFGFRLGDRMFYPFRLLLGLRMGTLLNAAALLVLYRQVTVFLEWFVSGPGPGSSSALAAAGEGKGMRAKWAFWRRPSFLAFFLVCRFEVLQESGSYMVELAALPFFFEMIFLLVREEGRKRQARREAVVFCLCGGLLFCLKMTNIVYLAPLILLYLWKIRKTVSPGLFAVCLAAGAAPVCIYLIYNGITTGNPVFPYYNTIFQSPYYFDADFKDQRWGPQGLRELLLWAYYMIRYPEYRLSEIYNPFNADLAVIYLAVLGTGAAVLAAWAKRKKLLYRTEGAMAAVFVCSFAAWAKTTGHIRYFMAGILLGGVLAACWYLRLMRRGRAASAAALLLAVPFAARVPNAVHAVWEGREWALRVESREETRRNLPLVFRDHQLFSDSLKERIDVFFLTWGDYGSYARLIGEDVPVYNRYSVVSELSSFQEAYLSEIEGYMRGGKGVYDLFPQGRGTLEEYLEWMNDAGWYVWDLEYVDTILKGPQSYTAAGLRMADGQKNTWYQAGFEEEQESGDGEDGNLMQTGGDEAGERGEQDVLRFTKSGDACRLEAIAGDPDYWMLPFPFEIIVMADDGRRVKEAGVIPVGAKEYERAEVILDLSGLEGDIELTFKSSQEGKIGIVINPALSHPDGGGYIPDEEERNG